MFSWPPPTNGRPLLVAMMGLAMGVTLSHSGAVGFLAENPLIWGILGLTVGLLITVTPVFMVLLRPSTPSGPRPAPVTVMLRSLGLQLALLVTFMALGLICSTGHRTHLNNNKPLTGPARTEGTHNGNTPHPGGVHTGDRVGAIPSGMLDLNEKSIITGMVEGLPVAGPRSTTRFLLWPGEIRNSKGTVRFPTPHRGNGEDHPPTPDQFILITADSRGAAALAPGDLISIHAKLRSTQGPQNPHLPDSSAYYAKRHITALAGAYDQGSILLLEKSKQSKGHLRASLLHRARSRVREVLTGNGTRTGPANQLMQALILGDGQGIDQDLKQAFATTGTSHLLAVSGLHLGLIALFLYNMATWFLKRLPRLTAVIPARQMAAGLTLAGAWMFTLFSGSQIPAVRASVMVSCNFAALLLMRAPDPLSAISLAFLVLVLPNPPVMLDVSFQLSFVAVLSLMLMMPSMPRGQSAAARRIGTPTGTTKKGEADRDPSAAHHTHWSWKLLPGLAFTYLISVAQWALAGGDRGNPQDTPKQDRSPAAPDRRAKMQASRRALAGFFSSPDRPSPITGPVKTVLQGALALGVTSTVASLATLPLTASHFSRFTPWAPFANLLAVPLTCSILMPMLLTVTLLSPLPLVGNLLIQPVEMVAGLLAWLIKTMASLTRGELICPAPSPLMMFLWYLGMIMVFGTLAGGGKEDPEPGKAPSVPDGGEEFLTEQEREKLKSGKRRKGIAITAGIALMAVAAALLFRAPSPDQDYLELIFLDVGQGDSMIIRMPGGGTVMVDGGSLTSGPDPGKTIITPYLKASGIKRINTLVLTHGHPDHCNGLVSVLNNFPVDQIWHPGGPIESPHHREFMERAEELAIPMVIPDLGPKDRRTVAQAGQAKIQVVHPLPYEPGLGANDNSIVLLVTMGKTRMLLTGDLEEPGEGVMMEVADEERGEIGWLDRWSDPHHTGHGKKGPVHMGVDLLKVGHHGSGGSTTDQFLSRIKPKHGVICVGSRNTFGHPAQPALNRLKNHGVKIWRTDLHGAITVKTDGEELLISSMRGEHRE